MFQFKTESLDFYGFDVKNKIHLDFLEILKSNETIKFYLGDLAKFINEFDESDKLNNTYVVGDKENLYGIISLFHFPKVLEFNRALVPSARGKGIGTRILKESGDYFLKNYRSIQYLRLFMSENNISSITSAQKAGFYLVGYLNMGDNKTMIYEKSRGL